MQELVQEYKEGAWGPFGLVWVFNSRLFLLTLPCIYLFDTFPLPSAPETNKHNRYRYNIIILQHKLNEIARLTKHKHTVEGFINLSSTGFNASLVSFLVAPLLLLPGFISTSHENHNSRYSCQNGIHMKLHKCKNI